jgi:chromosomal replication initiator protein
MGRVAEIIWQTVLDEIELNVSRANFTTWFKKTALLSRNEEQVTIGVPSIFAKKQFEDKFNKLIVNTLKKNDVSVSKVQYVVQSFAKDTSVITAQPTLTPPYIHPAAKPKTSSALNAKYTFDNFVVGSSNELAYAAAQAIVRDPGAKYNPFFIYGGVGLGKTHLIQAIGNEILHRTPSARIEYITCERFAKEFVASILQKQTFSNHYRNADVLIIDDIQFISGKEKTQEEFFHVFNALHQNNKQIIISSDKSPKAIPTLEERLRSRFEWGMTADIQAPDYETRIAIIQSKASKAGIDLSSEIAEFLASQIKSNIRELEGVLTKLIAHCEMRREAPSMDLVTHMISPSEGRNRNITPRQIVDKTARFFNISPEELSSAKRDKLIIEPRQIAMYLLRTELHLSFPQIAKQVGRSDHSTAIHSVSKIEKAITNNHYLRQRVFELKEKLYV